jgi:hypothetical protein
MTTNPLKKLEGIVGEGSCERIVHFDVTCYIVGEGTSYKGVSILLFFEFEKRELSIFCDSFSGSCRKCR